MTDVLERPATVTAHSGSQHPATAPASPDLEWEHTDVVEPAVWIGRYKGVFVGMIEEREPEGFVSMTRLGRNLGRFDDLEDAKAAFLKH